MGSYLSDHELNIDCYMHKMLFINLMVTTNQKPVINIQKIKRKESKYITKESQQNMKKSKRKNNQRKTTKTTNHKTSKKMAIIHIYQ